MKKICLSITGLVLSLFSAFAQSTTDSSTYQKRKLNLEEVNIVSSYYHQDGNNAAVTGGIGSEKLTDLSNTFDIHLSKLDRLQRKHNLTLEVGIDHYTSASSDKINPQTLSSASSADTRFYPSVGWSMENERTGRTLSAGASFSSEFDYRSVGFNVGFSQKTKDRNGEFSARIQAYLDNLSYILPVELRTAGGGGGGEDDEDDYPSKPRTTIAGSLSYSQVINQRLQVMLLLDLIHQQGYLGLPFHRVYFADNSVHVEKLPDNRFKIPVGLRLNYFAGDKVILRTFYRYYQDSWGLKAHTFDIETPVKITPFFSVSPFYRHYIQAAVDYFAPYRAHTAADAFYTSNYDLSAFNSDFYGAGVRLAPPSGVLGIKHIAALELRYGHYSRTTGMQSDIVSLHLKFR